MDWFREIADRTAWIESILREAHCRGIVLGLSGGKDSAVVAALCRRATEHVLGLILPCRSLETDRQDALDLARAFDIETLEIDLESIYRAQVAALQAVLQPLPPMVEANLKPRLRMMTLYAVAQSYSFLVAGTSNRSERVMGYFTKWGDGACDFNPIADLTVREVLQLGEALGISSHLLLKPPSAGLWLGQTDEDEMGISYADIDSYLLDGTVQQEQRLLIENAYARSEHKRQGIGFYRLVEESITTS